MLEIFRAQMGLAEPETIQHFPALVQFVELWNRHLQSPLPVGVLGEGDASEDRLKGLYDDIEKHFRELSDRLR